MVVKNPSNTERIDAMATPTIPKQPENVAKPKLPFLHKFLIVGALAYLFIFSIKTRDLFALILTGVIIFGLILYRFFGFKQCPSCNREYIPKSKQFCYQCWRKSVETEFNQSIKSS